jgi:hypothetical protein
MNFKNQQTRRILNYKLITFLSSKKQSVIRFSGAFLNKI